MDPDGKKTTPNLPVNMGIVNRDYFELLMWKFSFTLMAFLVAMDCRGQEIQCIYS